MDKLIRRLGGTPLIAPSMREVPLEDQAEAFQFAQRLLAGTIDVLILMTGVGTRTLLEALSTKYPRQDLVRALFAITLVARGPKPIIALGEAGLKPTVTVPEPNTWKDILAALDAHGPLASKRVAVQEYGVTNDAFLKALIERSAEVIRVPVYRWALPEDLGPLRQAVRTICDGRADILLFTSATQLDHLMQVTQQLGLDASFRAAAAQCVIGSIGPVCSEALARHKLQIDLEPAHPHMGSLLSEAARKSRELLQRKRGI